MQHTRIWIREICRNYIYFFWFAIYHFAKIVKYQILLLTIIFCRRFWILSYDNMNCTFHPSPGIFRRTFWCHNFWNRNSALCCQIQNITRKVYLPCISTDIQFLHPTNLLTKEESLKMTLSIYYNCMFRYVTKSTEFTWDLIHMKVAVSSFPGQDLLTWQTGVRR